MCQALYTFGQPRVGNGPFAAWFVDAIGDTPYFRVVHDRDPIPHFPPVMLGFAHSPVEVFYNEPESAYRICDATGEDPTCRSVADLAGSGRCCVLVAGY